MSYAFKDYKEFSYTWKNNGLLPAGDPDARISMKDALSTSNAPVWMPRVITETVREAVEPMLMATGLFTRVPWQPGATIINFPAVGAMEAADIAEGQAYPEKSVTIGGASMIATIGKSGIAVKFTDEMIQQNMYNIVQLHLQKAGQAMARHKEKKAMNFISSVGTKMFDNANPTSSLFGVTHGRGFSGTANGSLIVDDLFDGYCQLMQNGFTPDTLLFHPLTWKMFIKDPMLRLIASLGGNAPWYGGYSGTVQQRTPWDNLGGKLASNGIETVPAGNAAGLTPTAIEGYPQTQNSAPQLPSYFPFPFRILVSPFVRFDPATRLTDIMMFDSSALGYYIEGEGLTTDEFRDPSVDITKIKIKERYSFLIAEEGKGVALFKNIKAIANESVGVAQPTISISGSLADIPMGTPVV